MSMLCKCGKRAFCIDSRYDRKRRETRRRYECGHRKCGYRWSTLEVVATGYNTKKSRSYAGALHVGLREQFTKEALKEIQRDVMDAMAKHTSVGWRRLKLSGGAHG